MANFKLLKSTILGIIIIFFVTSSIFAQGAANVLPLHTGKSYILDFPVKVTRVVGGDPSAMELNLFKKEDPEQGTGYQLLIAPISERTTNIIVWTDIGLYVFDVIIDNSSPYTADTIVTVPKEKKFEIPLVQPSESNIPTVYSPDKQSTDLTPEISSDLNSDNASAAASVEEESGTSFLDSPDLALDEPPEPDEATPDTKISNIDKPEKPPVNLKPLIKIDDEPEKTATASETKTKPEKKPEVIEINLKPQTSTDFEIRSSIDSQTSKLFNGKLENIKDGLKLIINSVNLVNNSLVIHLSLQNITSDCKYLLWDLTKVTDDRGQSLLVRNQNLPPGIVSPGNTIKGDIVAYTKSESQPIPRSGNLYFALLGLQGDVIFSTEIPLSK